MKIQWSQGKSLPSRTTFQRENARILFPKAHRTHFQCLVFGIVLWKTLDDFYWIAFTLFALLYFEQ